MANLLRVIGDPLSDRNIALVIKELDETAVAASVTGTSITRLKELAALSEPIADALTGYRPETRRAAMRLRQLAQNVRVAGTRAYQAPSSVKALSAGVSEIRDLVKKGLGHTEESLSAGEFEVINGWGYTDTETRSALRALTRVSELLAARGLGSAVTKVELVGSGPSESYDEDRDMLLINPDGAIDLNGVLRRIGERIWEARFGNDDRETWEGNRSRFCVAFATAMRGRKLDPETLARLQVTVGRIATKWSGE